MTPIILTTFAYPTYWSGSSSISNSEKVLEISSQSVGNTYKSIDKIIDSTAVIEDVKENIISAVQKSDAEFVELNSAFQAMNKEYDEVSKNIEYANELGTKKSSVYEAIANLNDQLKHLAN